MGQCLAAYSKICMAEFLCSEV